MDILRLAAIVLFVLAGIVAIWVASIGLDVALGLDSFGLACLAASYVDYRPSGRVL